jgi:hypothetical protein
LPSDRSNAFQERAVDRDQFPGSTLSHSGPILNDQSSPPFISKSHALELGSIVRECVEGTDGCVGRESGDRSHRATSGVKTKERLEETHCKHGGKRPDIPDEVDWISPGFSGIEIEDDDESFTSPMQDRSRGSSRFESTSPVYPKQGFDIEEENN